MWEFVNDSHQQSSVRVKEFLDLKASLKVNGYGLAVQGALIDTVIRCSWVPCEYLPYMAVNRTGFSIIIKKPPCRLVWRMLDFCLHCQSTVLTPFGFVRFKQRLINHSVDLDYVLDQ